MLTFQFTFTEAHLIEALRRLRRIQGLRAIWPALLLAIGVGTMVTMALMGGDLLLAIAVTIIGVALLFLGRFTGEYLTRRNFRKSPFHNNVVTVTLSGEGMKSTSPQGNTQLPWTSFTRLRRFPDGWGLLQGPHLIHWLPADSLTQGTPADIDALLTEHLGNRR